MSNGWPSEFTSWGCIISELSGKCTNRYEHFFGESPKFAHSLRTVGEAGTVKIKTDTTPKLEDCGIHCLFMAYSLSHPRSCYRMYNPKTQCVQVLRNVLCLHRMF